MIIDPHYEKTCLWAFRPGLTDTNSAVRPQKMARCLKFRIKGIEGLYYLCSENKGAEQLICTFVFAYAKGNFSHDAAQIIYV